MEKLQPALIKIARKLRSMSMDEVVEVMGEYSVSKMAISKFERGLAAPSSQTLSAIAQAYKLPVSFFYGEQIDMSTIKFRYKNDSMPSDKQKQVELRIRLKIEECYHMNLLAKIPNSFDASFKKPLVCTYADAERAADLFRVKWQLGRQSIHSVYETLEENGFLVIEMKIDDEDLIGASTLIDNRIPVVVINLKANATSERKRFTALHEAAHLVLSVKPAPTITRSSALAESQQTTHKPITVERLCHRFASAMLMPEDSLKRRLGEKRDNVTLKELISIKNMYGISIAAVVHRLHDLEIIPDDVYHAWFENNIQHNILEIGWGQYPIMEQNDWWELMEERLKVELFKQNVTSKE